MDNLMKLVKVYLEEIEKHNRFNNLIISNLETAFSDTNKVSEILNAMNNFNDIQYRFSLLREEITNPEDIVNVILKIRESSNYLILASNKVISMCEETNKVKDSFQKIINKLINHSNFIIDLMDDLLRYYLVNVDEELQTNYINSVEENELNKVLESLGRTISMKPNDTYAKAVVDKLLNRKVELMENNVPNEKIIPVK